MPEGKDMWIIFNQNSALAEFFVFSTIFYLRERPTRDTCLNISCDVDITQEVTS